MKKHLNYDENQSNGIVFNDTYTWGALYKGAHLKPTLSFDFDSFQATEVFNSGSWVMNNGRKRPMSPAEKAECLALADTWVQEPEQEGGTVWQSNKDYMVQEVDNMTMVSKQALRDAGYTESQISLLFPN